ncbi:MAG: hypothetical protein H2174_03070 [Vampirovibrio sp.]|jgi:hypothetical protein|nr:hypothetical protein [Vampirovibrio sp.]
MLNNLRISPVNIAPYASNRVGLLAYADYDNYMVASTQETMVAPKINKPASQPLLPMVNTNKLKADAFTRVSSNQTVAISPKNTRVDATTYAGQNRVTNVALKQPAMQARKALNFMA